MKNPGFEEGHT